MQKLKKSERRQFAEVCRSICEYLHLEHWQCDYKYDDSEPNVYATQQPQSHNNRIVIDIHPAFWKHSPDEQLWTLIHEHVHCMLQEYDGLIEHCKTDASADGRFHLEKMRKLAAEHTTDYFTTILFDLLHERF